jgi:hypothetical protein
MAQCDPKFQFREMEMDEHTEMPTALHYTVRRQIEPVEGDE